MRSVCRVMRKMGMERRIGMESMTPFWKGDHGCHAAKEGAAQVEVARRSGGAHPCKALFAEDGGDVSELVRGLPRLLVSCRCLAASADDGARRNSAVPHASRDQAA